METTFLNEYFPADVYIHKRYDIVVVPQNFPSHISQNISRKILKLLKVVQGLAKQAPS